MALSTTEIQRNSDARRGVRSRGYKLKNETHQLIDELATLTGKPKSHIIAEAIALYARQLDQLSNSA